MDLEGASSEIRATYRCGFQMRSSIPDYVLKFGVDYYGITSLERSMFMVFLGYIALKTLHILILLP